MSHNTENCKNNYQKLNDSEVSKLLAKLPNWQIEQKKLFCKFKFKDFKQALEFVNKIGEIAEANNHHPDLHLSWGEVIVKIYTHAINDISEQDFILAQNINEKLI